MGQWLRHSGFREAAKVAVVNGLDGEDIGRMELHDLMNDLQLGEYVVHTFS